MQRSSSSSRHSGAPCARGFALSALLVLAVATAGESKDPAAATADDTESEFTFEPVDDRALSKRFELHLGKLKDAGETASAEDIREQLKRKSTSGVEFARHQGEALPAAEVYQRGRAASLLLGNIYKCDRCDNWHGGIAGGVVLTADGIAVTNHHVMDNEDAAAFGAMTSDGVVHPIIEVLAASEEDDVALVRLGGGGFTPAPLSPGDPVGTEVRVISHPDGRFYTYSEGVIARYFRDRENGAPRLQITADYARGSSGSGVFNESGALTGLVSATTSIYYNQSKEKRDNLQMVVKSSIPVSAIWDLVAEKSSEATPEAEAAE